MTAPLLEISGLRVRYGAATDAPAAVDGIDLVVREGQRVGLVGESGSGKSTLALAATGLLRPPGHATDGRIVFEGQDLLRLHEAERNAIRGARIAMVYQDPFTFLNPLIRVGDQIGEALEAHRRGSRARVRAEVAAMLERLGLRPAAMMARKYPHQLSGGQRQRVVIAMALIGRPRLLLADEPTTALDVTVQARILAVLAGIITELGTSLLLISHDLSVIRLMCEFVYVMYAGQIVEFGPATDIFAAPRHPYTQALLRASRHELDATRRFLTIPGVPPDPCRRPAGCRFEDRCARRMALCATPPPLMHAAGSGTRAACWLTTA